MCTRVPVDEGAAKKGKTTRGKSENSRFGPDLLDHPGKAVKGRG